jgi:methylated-DNA-[protein]-cysteine S-methyltransferase
MTTPPAPAPAIPARLRRLDSPIGRIELTGDGEAVVSLSIERAGHLPFETQPEHSDEILDEAARQLTQYFAGERLTFDLPLRLPGTEFQHAVWSGLAALPFGEITSYGSLGRLTGRASAGRAVGGAVGANPIPIIVPCHRVLASNNKITGYSAGNGVSTKKWLLEHEGVAGFIRSPELDVPHLDLPNAPNPSSERHNSTGLPVVALMA